MSEVGQEEVTIVNRSYNEILSSVGDAEHHIALWEEEQLDINTAEKAKGKAIREAARKEVEAMRRESLAREKAIREAARKEVEAMKRESLGRREKLHQLIIERRGERREDIRELKAYDANNLRQIIKEEVLDLDTYDLVLFEDVYAKYSKRRYPVSIGVFNNFLVKEMGLDIRYKSDNRDSDVIVGLIYGVKLR